MRRALSIACVATLPLLSGCAGAAVPMMMLQSHKVDAVHGLEPGVVAVLAEAGGGLPKSDPRVRSFTDQLAAAATGHLEANLPELKRTREGAPKRGQAVVPAPRVVAERERDPEAFAELSLATLCRRLSADRVVFVEVTDLRLPDPADAGMTGAIFTPSASGTVRVVDRSGARTFPPAEGVAGGGFLGGGDGHRFSVQLRGRRVGDDDANPATLRRDLANAAGLEVARLFYDWTGRRPGDAVYEERRRNQGRPAAGDRR